MTNAEVTPGEPVPSTASLWRRVNPDDPTRNVRYWHIDQGTGQPRPTSSLFRHDPRSDGVSATIAGEAATVERELAGYPGFGLVVIAVQDALDCGYAVRHDPLPANPAHALLTVPAEASRTDRTRMAAILAARARWLVLPRGAPGAPR